MERYIRSAPFCIFAESLLHVRARGDNSENSDWDLLLLLDKEKITTNDYDFTYYFRELGWDLGVEISPHLYSKHQWQEWTFLPYYKNVEQDKIVLL